MKNTQIGIFVCSKHVVNSFPAKNDIYVCGCLEPIKVWIAAKEIKAGQVMVMAKRFNHMSLYLIGKDNKVIQISGIYDILLETKTVNSQNSYWVTLSKMITSVIKNCFDALTINELEKHKDELVSLERQIFEYVLSQQCNTWSDCKNHIKTVLKSMKNSQLSKKLLQGWSNPNRPSMKELHKPTVICSC